MQIIDMYYPDVRYILYDFSSNSFLDKNSYSNLK